MRGHSGSLAAAVEGPAGVHQLRLGHNLPSTRFSKRGFRAQDAALRGREARGRGRRPRVAVRSEGGEVRGRESRPGSRLMHRDPVQGLGQR